MAHKIRKRVRWITKNDERVCPICGPRHNRIYWSDKVPYIPVHDNCRCKTEDVKQLPQKKLGSYRMMLPRHSKQVGHEENLSDWRFIPPTIKAELTALASFTERSGREGSITFCNRDNRIFVGASARGQYGSTETNECSKEEYGTSVRRIGDAHSHPVDGDTIGILPSPSDITSTIKDSYDHRTRVVSCITSHKTPLINCYQPKVVPSIQKLKEYQSAMRRANKENGSEEFFAENVRRDFNFRLFNRGNGIAQIKPPPETVVRTMFGDARGALRKDIDQFDRDGACQYWSELVGQGHRPEVIDYCKRDLGKKTILGIFEYSE